MAGLLNKIAPEIAKFAYEKSMRIVNEWYDPSSFGNAIVEIASANFNLRVIRDRGQVTVEIRPSEKCDWHNLENILAFINRDPSYQHSTSSISALSENYDKVVALMAEDLSKIGFTEFEERQSAALLKKLFPPN
jgi:hypothetical protein